MNDRKDSYSSAPSELKDNTNFYDPFQIQESNEGYTFLDDSCGCSKGAKLETGEQSCNSRPKRIPEGKGEGSNIPFHNV